MFSTQLMDDLASVLSKIMHAGEGSYREKADEIRREMEEREAIDNLEEFVAWFPEEVAEVGGSD